MNKISTLIFDFANVLIFPWRSEFKSNLSQMYAELNNRDRETIWDEYRLNNKLMDFLLKRQAEYQLAVLTASYNLPLHPEINARLKEVFSEIYLASDLRVSKQQPGCYKKVLEELGAESASTVFVDDKHANTEAAKAAGLHAIQYSTNDDLFREFKKLNIE